MTHETNIFINRDQRACVRKSRWIPILLWRKCVHFVTAFAIWRLWKFLSNDSGAYWRFWLLSIIKLHFPSDAREAVPLCHSQNPSEMAAGSSTESGRVHVAHGWCPAHKEAVLFFRVAFCGAQLALGKMPGRQEFHPTRRYGESLHVTRQIFFSSLFLNWVFSIKGPSLWSMCFLTSRFLQNALILCSLVSCGLITDVRDSYVMPVLQGCTHISGHICPQWPVEDKWHLVRIQASRVKIWGCFLFRVQEVYYNSCFYHAIHALAHVGICLHF